MKSALSALALAATLALPGLVLPSLAQARQVTLTTTLADYGGDGAYLALDVPDAAGAYQGTLWLSGGNSRYYRHLSDWNRTSRTDLAGINGITGASVGAGKTLTVTVDLADALIDAGYSLHIDAAVEDFRESPSEIVVPLTAAGAGTPTAGRGYISAFTYDM